MAYYICDLIKEDTGLGTLNCIHLALEEGDIVELHVSKYTGCLLRSIMGLVKWQENLNIVVKTEEIEDSMYYAFRAGMAVEMSEDSKVYIVSRRNIISDLVEQNIVIKMSSFYNLANDKL